MNLFSQIITFLKGLFKKKQAEATAGQTGEPQKIKKLKESYQFFYNEGLTHLKSGDNVRAIEAFTKAIELKGNLKEAYCSRGTAFYKTGKENDALSDFMKAIEIDPEYEKAYYNLAAIKIASGDRAGAAEDLSAILEIDPWNAKIYFERASLKAQMGDMEGARSDFAQSIQLDPSYADKFIKEADPSLGMTNEVQESGAAAGNTAPSGSHDSPEEESVGTGHNDVIEESEPNKDEKHFKTKADDSGSSAREEHTGEESPLKKFKADMATDQPDVSERKKDFSEENDNLGTKKSLPEEEKAWADDPKPRVYQDDETDPDDFIKKALTDFSASEEPDELKPFKAPAEAYEPEDAAVRKHADESDDDTDEPISDRKFSDDYEPEEGGKKRPIDFETVYEDEKAVKRNDSFNDDDPEDDPAENQQSSLNDNDLESFVKDVDSILGKSTNKIINNDDFASPHQAGKAPVSFEYEDEKKKDRPYTGPAAAQDEEESVTEGKFNVKHEEQETQSATPRFKLNKKADPALEQAQEFYDSGIQKAKNMDFDGALEDFAKAIELVPKHAYAHLSRGKIKAGLRDHKGALEDYTKAISFESKFAEAFFCRANLHAETGNMAEAMNDYSRAIDSSARFIAAYLNRGLLYYKSGNYKEAIRDYTKAIIFDPRNAEAYLNRGLANYCINRAKAACDDWFKAAQYGIKQAEELIIRYAPRDDIRKGRK